MWMCYDVVEGWMLSFFKHIFFVNWKVLQKCHLKILVELLYIVS